MIPKILISAPTASAKNYCFEIWLENVMRFTWPNFEVVLFDNTDDGGVNADFLQDEMIRLFGKRRTLACLHSHVKGISSVIERMAISHNDCRSYAIKHGYTHWLHLETDVLPQCDILEKLYFHQKQVVGGIYYRDSGSSRKLCVQAREHIAHKKYYSRNLEKGEDALFITGGLQAAASIGMGCMLIHKSVFTKIPFRFDPTVGNHPDTYFSEDLFRAGIDIWADTSSICEHKNKAWGLHGIDYH